MIRKQEKRKRENCDKKIGKEKGDVYHMAKDELREKKKEKRPRERKRKGRKQEVRQKDKYNESRNR